MKYKEIEEAIIWEKYNKNLEFQKREKFSLEMEKIFKELFENKIVNKLTINELVEKSIGEYRSSMKDPIIEGLTLAKIYIKKNSKIYTNEDIENIDNAINQIDKVRKEIESS